MKKHYLLILILLPKICTIYTMNNSPSADAAKACLLQLPISKQQRLNFIIESNKRIKVQELIGLYKNINALPNELRALIHSFIYYPIDYDITPKIFENKNEPKDEKVRSIILKKIPTLNRKSLYFIGPNNEGDMFINDFYVNETKNILHQFSMPKHIQPYPNDDHKPSILHPNKPLLITEEVIRKNPRVLNVYLHSYKDNAISTQHIYKEMRDPDLNIQFGQNTIWIRHERDSSNAIFQYDYKGNLLSSFNLKLDHYVLDYHSVDYTHNYIAASYVKKLSPRAFTYKHCLFNDQGNMLVDSLKCNFGEPIHFEPVRESDIGVYYNLITITKPTSCTVNKDLNGTLLLTAARELLKQKNPDKTQCKEIVKELSQDEAQKTIREHSLKLYKKDIFKKLQ